MAGTYASYSALFLAVASASPLIAQAQAGWNVRDYGAVGDEVTDDTAAFQGALDAAGGAGGGIVAAPRGTYRIASHIVIPDNVTLEGVFTVPTAWTQFKGTTLLAVEGQGTEEGAPFISLGANSVVKGLTVFYPEQNDPANIRPYPWCIATRGADNSSIVDCLLVNPFNAVDFGTRPSGRHYIRSLYGQPIRRGIFIDKCYDVGRIENVHFWPFWNYAEPKFQQYLAENGEAMIFGRADWEYVLNTFVFGYKIGYKFIRTADGACNGNFLGIGSDASGTAVWVDDCWPFGLLITNGEFVAMQGEDPVAVRIAESCTGNVNFQNCAFWGPSEQILHQNGRGTTTFASCIFDYWDRSGQSRPAIEAESGQVIVQGCNFSRAGNQVRLGPDVTAAVIMGNRFVRSEAIANESSGSVQIGLNAVTIVSHGEIGLGADNRGSYVSQWDGEDCGTEAREIGGLTGRVTTGHYMLFGVDDALAGGGTPPHVVIEVTYLDEGEAEFWVEYDSSDQTVLKVPERPGAFGDTERVKRTNSGEWRTATFDIPDALFSGRCNGGDFRITSPDAPIAVSRVVVRVP